MYEGNCATVFVQAFLSMKFPRVFFTVLRVMSTSSSSHHICYCLNAAFCLREERRDDWPCRGSHDTQGWDWYSAAYRWQSGRFYFQDSSSSFICTHDSTSLAVVPRINLERRRSFSCADPSLWNALPLGLRTQRDPDRFRRDLKTHLFNVAFS